jgi:phospholipid/cholesterol/gamma-HCH transport system substrate-binding protein
MEHRPGDNRLSDSWWAVILVVAIISFFVVTSTLFAGTFRSYLPVMLTSDRTGLVMETGAKVKMRGVQVGRVGDIVSAGNGTTSLRLEIDPAQVKFIPANVAARINATTAFGAKFVDLVYPDDPSPERLPANTVLASSNVSTEVNTVFQNVVNLLRMVDPAKLNAVLTAVAEGVRGQGERMGQATTDLNTVLTALNSRNDIIREDWRSFKGFNETYAAAAPGIVSILNSTTTFAGTVAARASALDDLLMNTLGFTQSGSDLLRSSGGTLIQAVNTLAPTTSLLLKYNPVYTCWLQGATWSLENGAYDAWGGTNGKSAIFDVALLLGNDPYQYPENLPVVAAKGGPDGKPGCGSLPDATKNFPVRQLIANTGWGTGLDIRPNPGLGHPCWADFFPVTRAVPEPPSIRQCLPGPAPGPDMGPGMPPYGAAWYGPGGVPLWPGVPPAPAPGPMPVSDSVPPSAAPNP